MSRTPPPPRSAALLSGALALFALAQPVSAADFCVATAGALQTALTTAATNGQADSVKIVQGTYIGPFVYTSSERFALQVLGGYAAGCGSRTLDPANTTLQGDGANRVLTLTASNGGAFTVQGVTLTGGKKDAGDGGGLYASTASNIYLRDNIVQDNTASSLGGGVYLASKTTLYVERNTFSTNGGDKDTDQGGGLYVLATNGSLAMTGNTFTANIAYYNGAGAFLDTSLGTLTLTNNLFQSGNTFSDWSAGGGIFVDLRSTGRATLVGNDFRNNRSDGYDAGGGGAYIRAESGGVVTLSGNHFDTNTFSGSGAAAVAGGSGAATLIGNAFFGNDAGGSGGGAMVTTSNGPISLTGNRFDLNDAGGDGGGVYVETSTGPVTLAGNVYFVNGANRGGGAFVTTDGSVATLTNNTLENNAGGSEGGGLWLSVNTEDPTTSLYNNLFWNNHAPTGADFWLNNDGDGDKLVSPLALMHNNFDQTPNGGYWTKIAITIDASNLGLNKADGDPSPFDEINNPDSQHLSTDSPMIDKGDSAAPALPAKDMDGEDRKQGAAVDIGADEVAAAPPTYPLKVAKIGSGTVTSKPPGINCGSDCREDYPSGTQVTLTATPAANFAFAGWSGACTGIGACKLTMDAAKDVTATFVALCLKINDVSKLEGNSGTTDFVFKVTLSQPSTSTVTASYAAANGTAKAGSDYVTTIGDISFNPQDVNKQISVKVIGDTIPEANETFFVDLKNPRGATLCDGRGRGIIRDDDSADFVVTGIKLTEAKAGGTFTAEVTVKNQGTASGDAGFLDIWNDQPVAQTCPANGIAYGTVGPLAAGASKTLTFTGLRSGAAGIKTFRAFVDSYCQTPETNETNNQAVKSYTVAP